MEYIKQFSDFFPKKQLILKNVERYFFVKKKVNTNMEVSNEQSIKKYTFIYFLDFFLSKYPKPLTI